MKKISMTILAMSIIMLSLTFAPGWIRQPVDLDPQFSATITDTSATSIVTAVPGLKSCIVRLEISTNTDQLVTVTYGTAVTKNYWVSASSTGIIDASDGVCGYTNANEAITVTCSASSTTYVTGKYTYK